MPITNEDLARLKSSMDRLQENTLALNDAIATSGEAVSVLSKAVAALIASNTPAPAPPPVQPTVRSLGLNMAHLEQVADFYPQFYFDRIKSSRGWSPVATPGGGSVVLDKNGWPTEPCVNTLSSRSGGTPTSDSANMKVGEVYKCRVDSLAAVGGRDGCKISNVVIIGSWRYFDLTVTGTPVNLQITAGIPLGIQVLPITGAENNHYTASDFDNAPLWDPARLDFLSEFGGLRSMKMLATEGNPTSPPNVWARRPTPTTVRCGYIDTGVPLEHLVNLANTLYARGTLKRLAISFHHLQDLSYIEQAMTLVKALVLPGLELCFARSNEVWNVQYQAQGYFQGVGRQLAQSICNNMDGKLQQILSMSRVGNVVTVITKEVLETYGWNGVPRRINANALGMKATNVTATPTQGDSFTFPCTGQDMTLTADQLRNVTISGRPGYGVDYDNVCSFDKWRDRAYASDTRNIALLAESVFGPGKTKTYLEHQFVDASVHMLPYLAAVYTDRPPSSYLSSLGCAIYLEPTAGKTVDEVFTALDNELLRYTQVAKCWAQTAAAYDLKCHMYEWGFDMRKVPAPADVVSAVHDDPRMEVITRRLFQTLLDLGFEGGYYHIATPMATIGKGFNLCKTFDDVSPKRKALRSMMDVVPRTIDALYVIPGSFKNTGWPGVSSRDSYGYVGGSSEAWLLAAGLGGHWGLQGSTIAQRRWFERMFFALDAGDFNAVLTTSLRGTVSKVWSLTVDGREIPVVVQPSPGQKYGYYDSPQAAGDPIPLGRLEAGWHRVRITTHQIQPKDQIGCDQIDILRA